MQQIIQEDLAAKNAAIEKKKKRARTGIKWDRLFMACAYNWYWFILSMIVCASIAYLYAKTQPQYFIARSSILIRSKDSAQGTPSMTFSDLGLNTVNYIPNEPYKLRSSRVMEIVVNSLGLNVQYYGHMFLRDVNIYKNTPVQVTPLKEVTRGFSMTIVPKSNDEFEFKVNDGDWKKAHFGNKVSTEFGPVAITKTKKFGENFIDYTVIVNITNPSSMARSLASSLMVENADQHSDVLNLAIRGQNAEMCADILNALVVAYNQEGINDMNQVARNTEAFIAEPFEYTFAPVPISDEGVSFLDMPNLQFSVNKDSANLDMANEFMRFLVTSGELNEMAQNKGLMSPTKDLSFDNMYAAFGNVPEDRILQIKARLKDLPETFSFETLIEDCDSLREYVVTFIAILDMAKDHYLVFTIDEKENIWFSRGTVI